MKKNSKFELNGITIQCEPAELGDAALEKAREKLFAHLVRAALEFSDH